MKPVEFSHHWNQQATSCPSLAASRAFLHLTTLSKLYFGFRRFMLLVRTKKSDFYEQWQQHKQPWKWVRLDLILSMWDIYINSNLNPLTKFIGSSRSTEFKFYPPMEHLSNDHEEHPNQHKNSHKQCDEMRHPVVNMMESQWKLRQQLIRILPMEGKPL